ncbi:MAG: polysaccharide biosynthesis tyrosine autokinase [Anaerolineae bacterium]|nr:polysaccharide biosynthesis tyrosine autokinase [Anaerolineae bacterium]
MELAHIVRLMRRWGWLMIVMAMIAGGVAYVTRSGLPPTYRAETIIVIGSFMQASNPQAGEISAGVELVDTYAELVITNGVLESALQSLGLNMSPQGLRDSLAIDSVPNTPLLVLSMSGGDAVQITDILNAVADQLILSSPTNITPEQQEQIDLANEQIMRLRTQLDTASTEQLLLDQRRSQTTDPVELEQIERNYTDLTAQINSISATIALFNDTVTTLQRRTNSVEIVEPARVPAAPVDQNLLTTTLLGAVIGAVLAFSTGAFIDYLDDTLTTSEQLAKVLGLPVLGVIGWIGKSGQAYREQLISELPLMVSQVAEGYRTIRTNLLFSAASERRKLYLITSAGPQEGKSLTSANLAISMALAGQRVLLIDCDLRRPRLHEIFGLKNDVGLTTLLMSSHQNGSSAHGAQLSQCVQKTHVEKLYAITSGFIPQNPNEILGSALMQHWMRTLQESPDFDVILLDTPPALLLSDSVVLSASTNAEVVLIVEAGRTRRAAAQRVKEMFAHTGCHITGAILNGVSLRDESYTYGYGYGYGSYYDNSSAS